MTQFSPIRSYDVPELALARVLDGTLTAEDLSMAAAEAAGGEPRLGIAGRADLAAKLGEQSNPLVQAFVNVATNPLSYLFLLAHVPAGKIAGGLFRVAPAKSAAVMRRAPVLHILGLASGNHLTRGTPMAAFVDEFTEGIREWSRVVTAQTETGVNKLIARNAHLHLTPEDLVHVDSATGAKGDLLRELSTLFGVRLSGRNKERVALALRIKKTEEGLELSPVKQKLHALVNMTDAEIDERIAELGGSELLQEALATRRKSFELLFLDDAGEISAEKVARVHSSRAFNKTSLESMAHAASGDDAVAHLFGDPIRRAIDSGDLSQEDFLKLVKEMYNEVLKGNEEFYLPRNVLRITDSTGVELPPTHPLRVKGDPGGLLGVSKSVRGRITNEPPIDPTDLNDIERFLPVNKEAVASMRKRIESELGRAAKSNDAARFERIRPFKQLDRYYASAGRTYALYIRKPSERALALQSRILGDLRESEFADDIRQRGGNLRGISGDIHSTEADDILTDFASAGHAPPGGFTVADGIDQAFRMIPHENTAARRYVTETLVPLITGRAKQNDVMGTALKQFTQSTADSFLKTDIGKALLNSKDKNLRRFAEGLKTFSESSIEDLGNWSASMARYFYVTHLGLNFGSVLRNLTQPLVTTARWVEPGDLIRGYSNALKQYMAYVSERVKLGPIIEPAVKEALHKKHFRLFHELGLAEDSAFELLDSSLQRSGAFSRASLKSKYSRFQAMMLGPFQEAEVFNRLVTAEAFAAKAERLGIPLTNPIMLDEIRRGNLESQFGASMMNTPAAFLSPKSPLSNPLVKQFLQFPTRMLTSPFEVGSVANRADGGFGILNDIARGVGISAIGYEALKAFNVDVSQVGFLESSTQLFSGFVDDRDGPIPIPPFVQIASDTAKMLTGQDNDFFKYTLPRLVPGGLALARATNVLPDISGRNPIFEDLLPQRRIARWDLRSPEGLVPVFDTQGRLLEQTDGLSLLMGGLGLDLNGYRDRAQIDRFLVTQRDEISRVKREFRRRLFANDYNGARELQDKFKRRFGFELRLKKSDIATDQNLRTATRAERALDRLPREVRPAFTEELLRSRTTSELNFTGSQREFIDAETSRKRANLRRFSLGLQDVPPEFITDTDAIAGSSGYTASEQ